MQDSHGPLANTFVLKTYLTHAEEYYHSEIEAFKKIKKHPGSSNLITFYGGYQQGKTYNLILEYADKGSLENYFSETIPPADGKAIVNFWSGLFGIIGALKAIHDVEISHMEGPQVLQRYVLFLTHFIQLFKLAQMASWRQTSQHSSYE